MPVDRGFLSGWVDDDGSGNTGTIWNKARIAQMCDGIDAGIVVPAAWTLYTPTFKTSGTPQPAIGDGSIQGAYHRVGKIVHFVIYQMWGSTTTPGSGIWLYGMPPLTISSGFPFGGVWGNAVLAPGATFYNLSLLYGYISAGADISLVINGSGHASQGVPVAMATGARVHIGGSYMTP